MKIAIISDTHIGARNDSNIFNEYFLSFMTEDFIPYLIENHIQKIFHLGDLFDRRKYINFQTLHLWNTKFFDVLLKNNIQMYITCGNHDVYYKNTNQVNSLREVLHDKYSNIIIFDNKIEQLEIDNCKFLFVPWVNVENSSNFVEVLETSDANICLGHFDIVGFEMYKGSVNQNNGFKAEDFFKFERVLTGHYHHRSTNNNITYIGSPYEIIASDYNDPRGFHTLDTITKEITFIPNTRRMFHRIRYDDTNITIEQVSKASFSKYTKSLVKVVVQKKTNEDVFTLFMSKLQDCEPHDVIVVDNVIENIEDYDEMIQNNDTRSILQDFVKMLNYDNEAGLQSLLDELYIEALNVDTTEL